MLSPNTCPTAGFSDLSFNTKISRRKNVRVMKTTHREIAKVGILIKDLTEIISTSLLKMTNSAAASSKVPLDLASFRNLPSGGASSCFCQGINSGGIDTYNGRLRPLHILGEFVMKNLQSWNIGQGRQKLVCRDTRSKLFVARKLNPIHM